MSKAKKRRKYWRRKLFALMAPIKGEIRTVARCQDCDQFVGRRFIPFAIGRGLTVNPCGCLITNNCRQLWDKEATKTP